MLPMQQLFEAARIAAGSIWAHKLRSFLTLLGVIIGVFVVIAVATVIAGANAYVDEKLASLGSNVFFVSKAAVTSFGDFDKFIEAMRKNPDLVMDDVDAIREGAPSAEYVGATDGRSGDVRAGSELVEQIGIQGCTPTMVYMSQAEPVSGRYVGPFDEENRRMVVFIGSEIAGKLFPNVD